MKLGRPKIDSAIERKVRKQLAKGVGILKVAKSLGIGTGTVQRIANELGERKTIAASSWRCAQSKRTSGRRRGWARRPPTPPFWKPKIS